MNSLGFVLVSAALAAALMLFRAWDPSLLYRTATYAVTGLALLSLGASAIGLFRTRRR